MVAYVHLPNNVEVKNLNSLQQRLIAGLETLPEDISLCVLDGNKKPLGTGWQANPFTKAQVLDAIVKGIKLHNGEGKEYHYKASKIKGYGIITGTELTKNGERYYVMALDNDGPSAGGKVTELSGGIGLPKTVRFTSGREGRFQSLFLIPETFAPSIQTKKIPTQPKTETQELEQLEFRWTGHQSCLPPSVHPSTGEYVYVEGCAFGEVEIAIAPDWLIEQMLTDKATPNPTPTAEATPKPMQTTQPKPDTQWSERDWALSYLEALSPSRADSYHDWLNVGMALHSVDDSLLTDWDAWSRASTKYKPGECDKKWASFGKRSGIKLGTLGKMAKEDGWRKPTGRNYAGGIGASSGGSGGNGNNRRSMGGTGGSGGDGNDGNGNDKVVKFPGSDPQTQEWVFGEIDEFIAQGVTGSLLTGKLNRLAAASQIYVGELRKLYYERLSESDLDLERDTHQGEIEKLLKLTEACLDLNDYLPPLLAEPITLWCQWLSLRPAVALTALLSCVSSLHRVGTELVLHRNQNFRVPPTVYAALVADSGQRKSPILRNIITQPLRTLRQEKNDAYQAAMEDYETALEAWENSESKSRADKPEKPPDPTVYFFTNATGESIPIQASKAPEKPLLALIDELSGLFNSENAYRKGRGSDKQDLLSYFDGTGQTVLRASGVKVDVDRIYLSIFGTIQPEVQQRLMTDCSDPDGQWARFLFVNQPLEPATLSDDDGEAVQIHERLADFYRKIERLPEMEYRLSRAAFKRYQPVFNELERLRVTHPKSGMRAIFSKMEGYIGRLALNLHVLWEIAAGKVIPDEEVPLFIMEMAIQLAKFYFGQVKLIHASAEEDYLPAHLTKMIALSQRLEKVGHVSEGWLKAKNVSDQYGSKKRPKAATIYTWMQEAVSMGLGIIRGAGNRMEFHWMPSTPPPTDETPPDGLNPNDDEDVRNEEEYLGDVRSFVPNAETFENQGVEDNVRKVRNIRNESLTSKTLNSNVELENENATRKNDNDSLKGGVVPNPDKGSPSDPESLENTSVSEIRNNVSKGFLNVPNVPNPQPQPPAPANVQPEMRRMNLRNKRVRIYANGGYPEAVGVVLQGDMFPGPITVRVLGGDFNGKEWIVGEYAYELIEGAKGFGRR